MLLNNRLTWVLLTAVPCSGFRTSRDFAAVDVAGLLSPRDACSDAFGDNASNSICAPSNTLCCVRQGERYPSCQQYLDKGWCCVGNSDTDNCYVDQASSCDEPNSVPCNDLADGATEACCPRLTSCQPGFGASEGLVRCNILYTDLVRAAESKSESPSATPSKSSSKPTADPTSEPTSASTTDGARQSQTSEAQNTSTPSQDSGSHLSGGAIGGIAVAGTLAVVAALIGGFLLYRRQKKRKNLAGAQASAYPHSMHSPKPLYYDANGQIVYEQVPHGYFPPAEIMTTHPPAELDGSRSH